MYGQGLSRWPQGGGGAAAGLVTRARAQAVAVRLTTAERSFYEQIVARARPARAALQAEDAAGGAAGAAAGAPGAPTAAEARRRRAARERALGAAGEALLQARRCCDHPQLTAYWRTLAADLQLGQARARCRRPPRPEPLPQAPPVSGGPCPPTRQRPAWRATLGGLGGRQRGSAGLGRARRACWPWARCRSAWRR